MINYYFKNSKQLITILLSIIVTVSVVYYFIDIYRKFDRLRKKQINKKIRYFILIYETKNKK